MMENSRQKWDDTVLVTGQLNTFQENWNAML